MYIISCNIDTLMLFWNNVVICLFCFNQNIFHTLNPRCLIGFRCVHMFSDVFDCVCNIEYINLLHIIHIHIPITYHIVYRVNLVVTLRIWTELSLNSCSCGEVQHVSVCGQPLSVGERCVLLAMDKIQRFCNVPILPI